MPIATILLHLGLISAACLLLMLICSTGNFAQLEAAVIWISLDLMVSIAGLAFGGHPQYGLLIPRLALFHFGAMALCLIWMGADAWRGVHPLSNLFFFGFAAYAASRALQFVMYRWRLAGGGTLEAINAITYLAVVGLMIAGLLLPVPPSEQPLVDAPCVSPVSQMPCPGLAREARQ